MEKETVTPLSPLSSEEVKLVTNCPSSSIKRDGRVSDILAPVKAAAFCFRMSKLSVVEDPSNVQWYCSKEGRKNRRVTHYLKESNV